MKEQTLYQKKLSEVLDRLWYQGIWSNDDESVNYKEEVLKAQTAITALVEETVLGIMGEDEDLPVGWHHNNAHYHQPKARNQLRQELRRAINNKFGGAE